MILSPSEKAQSTGLNTKENVAYKTSYISSEVTLEHTSMNKRVSSKVTGSTSKAKVFSYAWFHRCNASRRKPRVKTKPKEHLQVAKAPDCGSRHWLKENFTSNASESQYCNYELFKQALPHACILMRSHIQTWKNFQQLSGLCKGRHTCQNQIFIAQNCFNENCLMETKRLNGRSRNNGHHITKGAKHLRKEVKTTQRSHCT